MTVYVDDFNHDDGKGNVWCHLIADTDEELESFARRLGLQPSWKHNDHYDLKGYKKRQAIILGAKPVSARFGVLIRKMLRKRGKENIQ